jgi:hypothetical protein
MGVPYISPYPREPEPDSFFVQFLKWLWQEIKANQTKETK